MELRANAHPDCTGIGMDLLIRPAINRPLVQRRFDASGCLIRACRAGLKSAKRRIIVNSRDETSTRGGRTTLCQGDEACWYVNLSDVRPCGWLPIRGLFWTPSALSVQPIREPRPRAPAVIRAAAS